MVVQSHVFNAAQYEIARLQLDHLQSELDHVRDQLAAIGPEGRAREISLRLGIDLSNRFEVTSPTGDGAVGMRLGSSPRYLISKSEALVLAAWLVFSVTHGDHALFLDLLEVIESGRAE